MIIVQVYILKNTERDISIDACLNIKNYDHNIGACCKITDYDHRIPAYFNCIVYYYSISAYLKMHSKVSYCKLYKL